MVRPSPFSLLQAYSALSHLRINHPLPLNPRESQQLLNLLTTSFRQHLDTEHGIASAEKKEEQAMQLIADRSRLKRQRASKSDSDEKRPVDRHIDAIVSNPLFSSRNNAFASCPKGTGRDPVDVFDEACAKGLMSLRYAKACLVAKKGSIVDSSLLDRQAAMKASGLGTKVLKWLVSSGLVEDSITKMPSNFTVLLFEFLVAEEQEETIWLWIETTMKSLGPSPPTYLTDLIYSAILGTVRGTRSLEPGYRLFTRIYRLCVDLDLSVRALLRRPALYLSDVNDERKVMYKMPTATAFDSFLQILPQLHTGAAAHLHLFHPTNPQAGPALSYFKGVFALKGTKSLGGRRYAAMFLDTVRFLLEHEQLEEARWLMGLARDHFDESPIAQVPERIEQAATEAFSLDLLKRLNLA